MPSLTLFTIPKPFHGSIATIQHNAIESWNNLQPQPEILLFGDEAGTAELAQELNLRHIPNIQRNASGTPLLNDIFAQAHQLATNSVLAYINADIILFDDFLPTIQQVANHYQQFLLLGRRWNLDITTPIDFSNHHWQQNLRHLLQQQGILYNVYGMDYFVFPKPLFSQIPEFAVGRGGWDNWMVATAFKQQYPVIDASWQITAIHQNHGYNHLQGGKQEAYYGNEAQQNFHSGQMSEDFKTTADATHYLIPAASSPTPTISLILAADNPNLDLNYLHQQTATDWELLLVDTSARSQNPPETNLPIRYLHYPQHSITAACNRGLESAQGEIVRFLTPEIQLFPHTIEQLINCFQSRAASLEFAVTNWEIVTENTTIPANPQNAIWGRINEWERWDSIHIWMLPYLWYNFHLSAVAFRRQWLEFCGGFHSQLSPQAAIIDVVLYSLLRGAVGTCVSSSTCQFPAQYLPTYTKTATDAEQLLHCFFQRENLPNWVKSFQNRAYYHTYLWLAWLLYRDGDTEQCQHYLNLAGETMPDFMQNHTYSWLQNCSQTLLSESNNRTQKRCEEFQQLLVNTLPK